MSSLVSITQNGQALGVAVVALAYLIMQMMGGKLQITDRFSSIEAEMKRPIGMGLIVILNGLLLFHNAKTPSRVSNLLSTPWAHVASLLVAGFIGSGDIETSVVVTLFVLIFMQLLRTPEERKKTPYLL